MKQLTLYHGTSIVAQTEILKHKHFKISDSNSDWLGPGIYMYEEEFNALEYNMKRYLKKNNHLPKYDIFNKSFTILRCEINVKEDEILDLNDFTAKYRYIAICKQVEKKLQTNKEFICFAEKLWFMDGLFLKYILNETEYLKNYKILTTIFDRKLSKKDENFKSRFAFEIKQRYYNILDDTCIVNIKNVNNDNEYIYNLIKTTYYNE